MKKKMTKVSIENENGSRATNPVAVAANQQHSLTNKKGKTFRVLLEKMTPVYTLVKVTATSAEDGVEQALESAQDFCHERLPEDGVWSLIPPLDIAMPTDDGEPQVPGICDGEVDPATLSCWDSNRVMSDGSIVAPHFIETNSAETKD